MPRPVILGKEGVEKDGHLDETRAVLTENSALIYFTQGVCQDTAHFDEAIRHLLHAKAVGHIKKHVATVNSMQKSQAESFRVSNQRCPKKV